MQKAYKDKGLEPPYKTLGAFRRAYRSEEGTTAYNNSHYWKADLKKLDDASYLEVEPKAAKLKDKQVKNADLTNKDKSDIINSPWKNDLPPRGQIDLPPNTTKAQFIQQELGVDKYQAERYEEAIEAYTGDFYGDIRAYQQGEKIDNPEEIQKWADDLESYIKAAPRWNGGETFRGIRLTYAEADEYIIDSVHDMRGMSSWSSKEEKAKEYADSLMKDVGIIFHCKTQSKGTGINHVSRYSGKHGEYEVLVSKDSKYKVVDIKGMDGFKHIYLEEV